jgi:hypothetical protein
MSIASTPSHRSTSCPRSTSCTFVLPRTYYQRTTSSPSSPSTRGMFAARMCHQSTPKADRFNETRVNTLAQGHILPKNYEFAFVTLDLAELEALK